MNEFRFEEISVGQKAFFHVNITEEMMTAFRKTTGDISPIHMDAAYAKGLGFSDRVVYGLLTASFYSTLVGVYLPGKFAILQSLDISFNSPVYIGNTLLVSGEIISTNDTVFQLELRASIKNETDLTVSKAKIKVGVREK